MKKVFRLVVPDKHVVLNSGASLMIALLMLFPYNGFSQNLCDNPPTVSLSATSGSTCYSSPFTLNGNTFGGSATQVTITTNGHGSITPRNAYTFPFAFTYTPVASDAGKTINITVTTNNPNGKPCKAATATFQLTVNSGLSAPKIESITQPTCTSSTGSVELSGLPDGVWTVTVSPGGISLQGSGATIIFPNLPSGAYTFNVSLSGNCLSPQSSQAVINDQPGTPAPPIPGGVTAPTCTVPSGSVNISGLPSVGAWTLTRYPGTIRTNGTGTIATVSDIPAGVFNFSVTNASGCISGLSSDVIIPSPPPLPSPPVVRTIVQPTLEIPTGSVTLNGLPSSGSWTILRYPGEVASTGTGTEVKIAGLETGSYTFRVRNSSGCLSLESASVEISAPAGPVVVITDPLPVCFPAGVDLTAPGIKDGSTAGLIYTYWKDEQASIALETPASAANGIYYIKGTASSGYFDIKPVTATVIQPPVSNAGHDQSLGFQFNTQLDASLQVDESGVWSSDSTDLVFNDLTDPHTAVSNLSSGANVLSWIVTNGICPADTDWVTINVGELVIPTLLTPNGDAKNDYFAIVGLETLGKAELIIFDRRGIELFRNINYDNKWDGVDNNNKPLMNDTYFFILKSTSDKSYTGYVVLRK